MGTVETFSAKEPRVLPLEDLGPKVPSNGVVALVAQYCRDQQQTYAQRQVNGPRGSQGTDHK